MKSGFIYHTRLLSVHMKFSFLLYAHGNIADINNFIYSWKSEAQKILEKLKEKRIHFLG